MPSSDPTTNCIGEYFGVKNVKAALGDYLMRNGNDKAAFDMLMVFAMQDQNKIIDIVCNYLDKNQLHTLTK